MKISLNWIREFTDIRISEDELVKKIGAQLGEIESVERLAPKYKGVVVAKIVSCDKHPNADKLSVCLIDDGKVTKGVKRNTSGYVQVVCGAPNVRAGLSVAWIPPGSIVPSTYNKEQFKLDVRPLRGVDSNGMLASPSELDISDSHDGILVIDKPSKPGQSLIDVYDLDDTIIDIENKMFTHRPDCFGILGVARELAGIRGLKFRSPKWYKKSLAIEADSQQRLPLKVENTLPSLVPRFCAVPMSGVKIGPSPFIMQSYLSRLGVKPINNVVDVTNFVMLLTAQPLHAYDYDKLAALDGKKQANIIVRKPKTGEKISLLNGKNISPTKDTIMIASSKKLIGVGGVMGGNQSDVDADTKNIVLECASFDMYSIRRASMSNGLFTDAVTRFNKGQSTNQNKQVIAYAVAMIKKLSGAKVAGKLIDDKNKLQANKSVKTDITFINSRLGLDLTTSEIVKILENVEFDVSRNRTELSVKAPFWRTDIEIPEDIVEEVGRLYGYDHLPLELPQRTLKPAHRNDLLSFKSKIRQILSSSGANEILTYSFVDGDLLDSASQDKKQAFKLINALSPELQYYRLSLLPSLLTKVRPNIKNGYDSFAIFEIGKTHSRELVDKKSKLPEEIESTALIWTAKSQLNGAAFYQARAYLSALAGKLGVETVFNPMKKADDFASSKPFDYQRSAYIVDNKDGSVLGIIGEFNSKITADLKLPESTAGFELWTEKLLQSASSTSQYRPLSKYPSSTQDLTLSASNSYNYAQVEASLLKALEQAKNEHGYDADIETLDIYRAKDTGVTNYTFRLTLSHAEKTLTTKEVNSLIDKISKYTSSKLN